MESCHAGGGGASSSLPFLVTAYLPDDAGAWVPSVMPTICPGSGGAGAACRISLDHRRARKTGPCVPVTVLSCSTHDRRFTIYPCGHVPYGREAVAPVDLDGRALSVATVDAALTVPDPCASWGQTRFAAVLDAAKGKAWPRDGPGSSWTTQLRRLDELAALLGLDPTPSPGLGEELARLIDVPRLSLIDDGHRLAEAHGYEERGVTLVETLERASRGRCILERVLACGALVGLWRAVHLWRPTLGHAQCTVFPGRGMPSG
jgi:hypothetical protein